MKLHKADAEYSFITPAGKSPWEVDTLEIEDKLSYKKVVDTCRFFYKHDPLASAVINKLVEISISNLAFDSEGLNANEMRIFEAISRKMSEFARIMALEYLLSGMVIPEVSYAEFNKEKLRSVGIINIKGRDSTTLPSNLWVRDSSVVEVKNGIMTDEPSYWISIPQEMIYFILNEGKYQDGTKDLNLYKQLVKEYPEFVKTIREGQTKIKLTNPLIFRGRYLSNSPYPVPYLYPVLESLKHKRNLRRMDYSLASRVITAIMLVKLGSDEFPVTEDDEYLFDSLKAQLAWRSSSSNPEIERIYQLFANHTVEISWVIPDVSALLNDAKYLNVNKDIIQGLGLPSILISGETEKSGSGGANDYSVISPESTMNVIREKILPVLQNICNEISSRNKLKYTPIVKFEKLNLHDFSVFRAALMDLYNSGNLSREAYAKTFGFNWTEEIEKIEKESKILETKKLPEFAPRPYSNSPKNVGEETGGGTGGKTGEETTKKTPEKEDTK